MCGVLREALFARSKTGDLSGRGYLNGKCGMWNLLDIK
ncbi:hypothetical protein KS4_15530 [Poriferisphaera corsica]|uniref:Uncharacterized protein n=1 Tax=Poriferisphaera corsica TaxID=2528020 RepID=A0A517YTE5_9BACT|nr:hypothetical protein KS4_15530 [Poriferisphaera corsica]